jgi:hypothetical protein
MGNVALVAGPFYGAAGNPAPLFFLRGDHRRRGRAVVGQEAAGTRQAVFRKIRLIARLDAGLSDRRAAKVESFDAQGLFLR